MEKLAVILLALALTLTSCLGYRVKEGTLRDTLFSVEQTRAGAYRIFVTHDDVAGYCTYDKETGEKAMDLLHNHNGEVLITFRFINEGDSEWDLWNGSDCKTTSSEDIYMFLMQDIEAVPARGNSGN